MRPLALRTVLAATDLTDASLPAVRTAAELARLAGARLHVVYAADPPDAEAGRSLGVHLRAAGVPPAGVASTRVAGLPADRAIVERAAQVGADVIALGPHRGRPGTRELGGTADRVVRAARVPCLVLPASLTLPLGRVLAAVDLTGAARGSLLVALSWASALRRRGRAGGEQPTELRVLYVEEEEAPPGAGREALHGEVEAVCAGLEGIAGVEVREEVARDGSPAEGILDRAGAEDPDLVVLGTHSQDPDAQDLLGSVSSGVARGTRRPVLLVPPAVWRDYGSDPLPPGSRPGR